MSSVLFYDPLWTSARLVAPERFNTWPMVRSLIAPGRPRLEVAPGLRPRLPIEGTCFVDISAPAVSMKATAASHRAPPTRRFQDHARPSPNERKRARPFDRSEPWSR